MLLEKAYNSIVAKQIKHNKIILFGDDLFCYQLILEKINNVFNFDKKKSFEINNINSLQEVVGLINSQDLFSEKALYTINFTNKLKNNNKILDFIEFLDKSKTSDYWLCNFKNKNKILLKADIITILPIEISSFSKVEIVKIVNYKLGELNIKFENKLLEIIYFAVQNNPFELNNFIYKLSLIKDSVEELTANNLNQILINDFNPTIYELIYNVFSKNIKKTYQILEHISTNMDVSQQIFFYKILKNKIKSLIKLSYYMKQNPVNYDFACKKAGLFYQDTKLFKLIVNRFNLSKQLLLFNGLIDLEKAIRQIDGLNYKVKLNNIILRILKL